MNASHSTITIKELIEYGIQQLPGAETARLDAELLLMEVLNCDRVKLKAYPEQSVGPTAIAVFRQLLKRRQAGEPIAYIVGKKDFWNCSLTVTPAVLVPRPETEVLVATALEKMRLNFKNITDKILDLGTGSGAVAIALAMELPLAQISAVDISPAALEIAQINIVKNKIKNVTCYQGDLFAPFQHKQEKFNLIVSNPPYIAEDDPHLQQAELKFEPAQALIAADAGLEILRRIISSGRNYLAPNGWLLVEHGYNQSEQVRELFASNDYANITSYPDLANNLRVTGGNNIDFK